MTRIELILVSLFLVLRFGGRLLRKLFVLMFSCVGAAALLRAIWARVARPARFVPAFRAAVDAAASSTVKG